MDQIYIYKDEWDSVYGINNGSQRETGNVLTTFIVVGYNWDSGVLQ